MIFVIITTIYLGFVGYIVHKRGNICGEAMTALFFGLIAILITAGVVTHILTPNTASPVDPNNWQTACIKGGGTITHKVFQSIHPSGGGSPHDEIVEECQTKNRNCRQ